MIRDFSSKKDAYEDVGSVAISSSSLPASLSLPKKLEFKRESRDALPNASALQSFRLKANNDRAKKNLGRLGEFLAKKHQAGRMQLEAGQLFLVDIRSATGGEIVVECAFAAPSPPKPPSAPAAPAAPAAPPPTADVVAPVVPPPPAQPVVDDSMMDIVDVTPADAMPSAATADAPAPAPPPPLATVAPTIPPPAAAPAEASRVPAFIVETHTGEVVAKALLGSRREWRIGRDKEGCQLRIVHNASGGKHTVSRRHAVLRLSGDGPTSKIVLADLDSTQGTYVNDGRGFSRLKKGDQLAILDAPTAAGTLPPTNTSAHVSFGRDKYTLSLQMVRGDKKRERLRPKGKDEPRLQFEMPPPPPRDGTSELVATDPFVANVPRPSSAAPPPPGLAEIKKANGPDAPPVNAAARGFRIDKEWQKVSASEGAKGGGLLGDQSLMSTLDFLGLAKPAAPPPKPKPKPAPSTAHAATDAAWRTGFQLGYDPAKGAVSGLRMPDQHLPPKPPPKPTMPKPAGQKQSSQPARSKPKASSRAAPAKGASAAKRPRSPGGGRSARTASARGSARSDSDSDRGVSKRARRRAVDSDSNSSGESDSDSDSDSDDGPSKMARAKRAGEGKALTQRVRSLGGGTMRSVGLPARPKLARVGGAPRRAIGSGHAREKPARRVWRDRLLGVERREAAGAIFHDEDFIEHDEDEPDEQFIEADPHEADSNDAASSGGSDDGLGGFSWRHAGEAAGQAVANRRGRLLEPPQAARTLDYEEVTGNFWLQPDGSRTAVERVAADELPGDVDLVDYSSLRAFNTGNKKGWGACCEKPIRKGQVITEATGRCLTEEQFKYLEDKTYGTWWRYRRPFPSPRASHPAPPLALRN